jgi:hypothetical protein
MDTEMSNDIHTWGRQGWVRAEDQRIGTCTAHDSRDAWKDVQKYRIKNN